MNRAVVALVACVFVSAMAAGQAVLVQSGVQSLAVDPAGELWPVRSGTVSYQGPAFSPDQPNWKEPHHYRGFPLAGLVDAVGGMAAGDLLWVVAVDGYAKALPAPVVYGESPLGEPILAISRDGQAVPEWGSGPQLVFLAPDGRVSNDDQVQALGEHAHYFQDLPSATGLLVKGVKWLVVNWDGDFAALPEVGGWVEEATLKVGDGEEQIYTLPELETTFVSLTQAGSYTTSTGREVTACWTGIPVTTLLGNLPADTQVEVVAADGYRMRYVYGELEDGEGKWILAFKRDGEYLPVDPGYFRLVKVGPGVPQFEGARSARMVTQLLAGGPYAEYQLRMEGAVERVFDRRELEAGAGCPCHTATVTFTRKGEEHTYTGFPLWRLVAYVDDDRAPPVERGIYYAEEHFNQALALSGYSVEIRAADGFAQTLPSAVVAGNDRFIIALKGDGQYLTCEQGGPLLFVWDDSAPAPAGLRKVKWVTEIVLLFDQ
ncbi:MAG: hypothetical protein ACP5G2_05195 [Candidatus Bipolaricaulaceae bacterium]